MRFIKFILLVVGLILFVQVGAIASIKIKEQFIENDTIKQADKKTIHTVKLNKSRFLAEVWDYQKNPKEWVYKGKKPALIDFYADWCGPCRTAAPILEEIAREFEGKIVIYKIDTQVEQELAQIFGISGIPAFLYIPMIGRPSMTSGIARTKEDTKKMFVEYISSLLLNSPK